MCEPGGPQRGYLRLSGQVNVSCACWRSRRGSASAEHFESVSSRSRGCNDRSSSPPTWLCAELAKRAKQEPPQAHVSTAPCACRRPHGSSLLIPTGQGYDVTTCVRPQETCQPDLGRLGCTDLSMGCSAAAGPTIRVAYVRNCGRCIRMSLSHLYASADVAARRGNCSPRCPMPNAQWCARLSAMLAGGSRGWQACCSMYAATGQSLDARSTLAVFAAAQTASFRTACAIGVSC